MRDTSHNTARDPAPRTSNMLMATLVVATIPVSDPERAKRF